MCVCIYIYIYYWFFFSEEAWQIQSFSTFEVTEALLQRAKPGWKGSHSLTRMETKMVPESWVVGGGQCSSQTRGQARSLSSSRSCGSPVPAMPGGRRASPGWQELTHHMTVPSPNYTPAAAAAAKSLQSCPTLCDPLDGSPPGSAIPGILRARTIEWVAISFSVHAGSKVQIKSIPWKIHLISKSCTC